MPYAARKLLGLRAHTIGEAEWAADTFYSIGDVVAYGGHRWRATLPTARGHAPQGTGDGGDDDRQLLLDACSQGWGAGTTGGGLGSDTYTVTSTDQDDDGTDTEGTLRHALGIEDPLWITFDPDVFDPNDPATITFTDNVYTQANKTIDGRGAGVRLSGYPIQYRSDNAAPLTETRGQHTANIIVAYLTLTNYPNESSVLTFGGTSPFRQGGADLVYLHHLTIHDIEDQNMSNSHHDIYVSRSTCDYCVFGPSPGPVMMSLLTQGGMKRFSVSSADATANTVTTLDALGDPTNHNLINRNVIGGSGGRANFAINTFRREDLATHPFPAGIEPGEPYTIRHVGQGTAKNFTADASTNVLTSAAHGYSNGDPVVLIGSALPGQGTDNALRNGYIYYVRDATTNTFKVAVNLGAAAKDFDTNGSGTLQVQKADLTKFQLSESSGQTGWTALEISGTGTGWYLEETEPVYYSNGKGPQWGSHHPDDVPNGFLPFKVNTSNGTITTLYDHGIDNGQEVRFWAQADNLPTGMVEGLTYYTRDVTASTFKLSLTEGGPAITSWLSAGASEQSFTADAATNTITAASHGLANGDMVAFVGSGLPGGIDAGYVYWVKGAPTTNTFQITDRKGDPVVDITSAGSGGTLIKKPPLAQLLIGPNRASIALCDFRNGKLRQPKVQIGWYHLWNNRVVQWGDPDRGDSVGGAGNEIAVGAHALVENSVFRPYASDGTEPHYWSEFTNPRENIPTRGPSIYAINVDSGAMGPVDTDDWSGGTSVIQRGNLFEDGSTTRNAQSGATVIVNALELDWYDGVTKPVPYDYEPIEVEDDPFVLDTILDRGAGNVQPWELID